MGERFYIAVESEKSGGIAVPDREYDDFDHAVEDAKEFAKETVPVGRAHEHWPNTIMVFKRYPSHVYQSAATYVERHYDPFYPICGHEKMQYWYVIWINGTHPLFKLGDPLDPSRNALSTVGGALYDARLMIINFIQEGYIKPDDSIEVKIYDVNPNSIGNYYMEHEKPIAEFRVNR